MAGEWRSDPTGRHERRWWDGETWTTAVLDSGVQSNDDPAQLTPPLSVAADPIVIPPASLPSLPPVPAPKTSSSSSDTVQSWIIAISGGAIVVGSFLPWATVGPIDVAGTEGDGRTTIGLGVAIGVLGILASQKLAKSGFVIATVILGAISTAIGYSNYSDINDVVEWTDGSTVFEEVEIGIGVEIVAIASAAATIVSIIEIIERRKRRAAATSSPPA